MNSLNRKKITYINTLKLAIVVTTLSMAIADISDPLEWLQIKSESHPKIGEKAISFSHKICHFHHLHLLLFSMGMVFG